MNGPEQTPQQAQELAEDHTDALGNLSTEVPAGSRTPEEEATLQEWHKEGYEMRQKAAELRSQPTHVIGRDGTVSTLEEHRQLVSSGEVKPTSGPTS